MRYRGEIAEYDKVDGNENPDKIRPYAVKIEFDGSEFFCRVSVRGKDFFFRGLSLRELKRQVSLCFPDARFAYSFSRSAELATNPPAILRG